MPLTSGTYLIFDASGDLIARRQNEDKSTNPKAVVKHVKPIPPDFAMWNVQQLIGGKPNAFRLSNKGNPTGPIDELVWAILRDEPSPETWIIEPVGDLPNRYIILTSDQRSSWIVPTGETDAQIQCRPLGIQPSVFEFVRVLKD